jgi:uncharacterized protein YbjQ (UPF0145 family)
MEALISWGGVAVLLVVGFIFGSRREKEHYEQIIAREKKLLALPVLIHQGDPESFADVTDAFLVTGSVVIASDYFKTFVAGIKTFFGGRLTTYESLMDRARREAILRLKENAFQAGATALINLRVETSVVQQQGVEILAYATAVRK